VSVWLCMPSKRPVAEAQPVIDAWLKMGYRVAVQRDLTDELLHCDINCMRGYSGYPEAATYLIHEVMSEDAGAEWFVCAGDDITPDPHKRADEIAEECNHHFSTLYIPDKAFPGTFGVMQPTGDRWGEGYRWKPKEAHIDCIAGSPWIGREFARRMYGGCGPYWTGYFHMFDDEELQCVATMMEIFWQRPDITHYHNHCPREGGKAPAFLARAYGKENWNKSKAMFMERKAKGFPGHEPIL